MHKSLADYETYREIMEELLQPIPHDGLDSDTLKRLYDSKLVYLESLRIKCFQDINRPQAKFVNEDYFLILEALAFTRKKVRELIFMALRSSMDKRRSPPVV